MDYANDPPSKLTARTSAVEHEDCLPACCKIFLIFFPFLSGESVLCICICICIYGESVLCICSICIFTVVNIEMWFVWMLNWSPDWTRAENKAFFIFSSFWRSTPLHGDMPGVKSSLPIFQVANFLNLLGPRGFFSWNGGSCLLDAHISTMPPHTKPL